MLCTLGLLPTGAVAPCGLPSRLVRDAAHARACGRVLAAKARDQLQRLRRGPSWRYDLVVDRLGEDLLFHGERLHAADFAFHACWTLDSVTLLGEVIEYWHPGPRLAHLERGDCAVHYAKFHREAVHALCEARLTAPECTLLTTFGFQLSDVGCGVPVLTRDDGTPVVGDVEPDLDDEAAMLAFDGEETLVVLRAMSPGGCRHRLGSCLSLGMASATARGAQAFKARVCLCRFLNYAPSMCSDGPTLDYTEFD